MEHPCSVGRGYRFGRSSNISKQASSIDEFLEGFPTVTREQVIAFLEEAKEKLVEIGLVRILLDESVDWRLSRALVGHDVRTARQMGWTSIKNGELLALASERFDVFVTVDRNLPHQQNIRALPIAIITLQAKTNRLADLLPLVSNLLTAIRSAKPGSRCNL